MENTTDTSDLLLDFHDVTVLKRRPLCKLITKTMVIQADGANLKFKDNLLGSLARLLPFDAIAALGDYPLHDKWTKTRGIQMR